VTPRGQFSMARDIMWPAPATGEAMAELILDGTARTD
jgi:hypothetical protein